MTENSTPDATADAQSPVVEPDEELSNVEAVEDQGAQESDAVFAESTAIKVDIPQTGEARVDAALAALADVDSQAPADAVEALGQVYDRLHRVLTQP
jgi:hypothetical protein